MTHLQIEDCVNDVCPWTGKPVSADALTRYKGKVIGFADRRSRDAFLAAIVAFETAILAPPRVVSCKAAA
ncbi:glutathione S-transferase [Chthonobacter rhizosphaerae]|uniref:glutathione S-transferase n=1 Tax=Chthonobacter rhizosphaerae TaxID=2735553 RepID=UPI0015EF122B|nr:glutathione S-transferase [Chthonobacter rhizosphaerae]